MPKRSPQTIINTRPAVHNGELVSASTVVQVTQLALNGPYRGDFQIIGQGRLIVGEHTDLGERVVATTYGLFGYDPNGANTFAVLSRQYGARGAGDVFAGYIDGNYLLFDQSEGTLGVYSPAGAGFIADSDGSLCAGDTDAAHMRWNSASRALEIRNGEDVKISLDANGDGFFDGTIYAQGGRIYGEMQVDSRLRAGDVDGPNVTLGKFERIDETSGALVESSEIVATDAANLPWFRVVAGGSTAGGGWFQVGNPGDYAGRMTYDGETLQVASWIVDSERLRSPGGTLNLSTTEGVQFIGTSTEELLADRGRMLTFWSSATDPRPTHHISAHLNDETPDNHRLVVQVQPLDAFRGSLYAGVISTQQAQTRLRSIGGYDTVNQQQAYIDLWAYREEGGGVFTHSRIDISADIIYPMPYTAATIPGGTIQNGGLINSNGTYEPGAGAGLYAYFGGYWKPLALVADGWEAVDSGDSGMTAGNVQFYTCDATGGKIDIALPAATAKPRDWEYTFYKSDSSANAIAIDADGSATINGALTYTLSNQHQAVTIRRVGANWAIKSKA